MNIIKRSFLFVTILGFGTFPMQAGTVYDVDLVKAAVSGKPHQVSCLLDQGADINVQAGNLKKTPLMFAIDAAAKQAEEYVSVVKGIASITDGLILGAGGLVGLSLLSPILLDPEFHKDAKDVVYGREQGMAQKLQRAGRAAINLLPAEKAPSDTSEVEWLPTYKKAIGVIQEPKRRVIAIVLATAVIGAGGGYGIYRFIKGLDTTFVISIRNYIAHYSRLTTIKTLLEVPSIDINIKDGNGQTALDLVRNYMINSENENVLNMMRQIEVMLLEKN